MFGIRHTGIPCSFQGLGLLELGARTEAPFMSHQLGLPFLKPSLCFICISLAPWAGGSLAARRPGTQLPAPSLGAEGCREALLPPPHPTPELQPSTAQAERSHGNRVKAQVVMPVEEQRARPAAPQPPARPLLPGWIGDRQGLNLPR